MEKITVEILKTKGGVMDAIEYAKSCYKEYPTKPTMPSLKKSHTSAEAQEYSKNLEGYEKLLPDYHLRKMEVKKYNSEIDAVIVEYIKEQAGLNQVPERSQEKVWSKAWQDGHSDGYYEVYLKLDSLVDLF